ncbi:hypothetical protein K2Z84_16050 [Candidatus Binatia bacterium]|nr:hypothetical protein [Candidatus Binatia bacterium]
MSTAEPSVYVTRMHIFLLVLSLLTSLAAPAHADSARDTLRGLEGVSVVAKVDEAAKQAGLTKEVVETSTEQRLREKGIAVFESAATPAQRAVLTVRVAARQIPSSTLCMFSFSLEVVQVAKMVRDEKIVGLATTWNVGSMGVGEQAEMRKALDAGLDRLSSDWLAVNPSEKSAPKAP